jgi:hypothetical protein
MLLPLSFSFQKKGLVGMPGDDIPAVPGPQGPAGPDGPDVCVHV